MIDLSIVIVSWNVASLLEQCLHSIISRDLSVVGPDNAADSVDPRIPRVEIIVVDSASSDDTTTMLRNNFPQVHLLAQSVNVGFTKGNNIGLARAQGRHLLLLNPDTEIIDDALSRLISHLDAHPDVGIVGPHTLNSDGSTQSSRRRFPTRRMAFFESTWLQDYTPRAWLDTFYVAEADDREMINVDWVQGSCLMARREVYEQIGGLDEGYVMYSEELDWCKRASDQGWRVQYVGTAQIIHHGGKSTEQSGPRKHIHFQQSKLRYNRKVYGLWFAQILRLFLLLMYAWQLCLEAAKAMLGSKADMRKERVQTYQAVLRSGLRVE